jgi:predicted MFS family arabinose efflux permease
MVMTIWDWMFVFYCAAAATVGTLVWLRWSRPKKSDFPKEWVCDTCGQICSHLRDGLCVYCDNQFTNKK